MAKGGNNRRQREHQENLYWAAWQLEIIRFTERTAARGSPLAEDGGGLQEASHALEVSKLKAELVSIETKLRESQSQRAILESVISERLASERAAITQAEGMRAALRTVTGRVSDLTAERERDRLALMALQTVNAASILNLVVSLVFHKRSRLVKVCNNFVVLWECSGGPGAREETQRDRSRVSRGGVVHEQRFGRPRHAS